MASSLGVETASLPSKASASWLLSPNDVEFDPVPFATSSSSTVHRGTAGSDTRVVVKRLMVDDHRVLSTEFETEVSRWHAFDHPNVVKIVGASFDSSPQFIVYEDAAGGSLSSYLAGALEAKRSMWRMLYEAGLGLDYLHRNGVVHGGLKLNNLLVSSDGHALVADYGFSTIFKITTSSSAAEPALNDQAQSLNLRWSAPECLRREPTFASDVYSFAMCIIEAVTGEPPFVSLDDESVRKNLRHGAIPDRPGSMPDEAWELVLEMTRAIPSERATVPTVLAKLKAFVEFESQGWPTTSPSTDSVNDGSAHPAVGQLPSVTPLYIGEATRTTHAAKGEVAAPAKNPSRVEAFLDLLKTGDERQQAQGVRELLLWLVDTVNDRTNAALVASSGIVDVLFDVAVSNADYFVKALAAGALDLLTDQGYNVAGKRVEETKQAVGAADDLDVGFIISSLQDNGNNSDTDKRDALVLCSCLATTHSDNQDLLSRVGVLPFLVAIIRDPTSKIAAPAALALGSLSCQNETVASQVAQQGAIDSLLTLIGSGLPAARAWAAYALGNLICSPDTRRALFTSNAVQVLNGLLTSGAGLQQQWGAYALATLASGGGVKDGMKQAADTIPVLLAMLRGSNGQKIWSAYAINALSTLLRWHPELMPHMCNSLVALLGSSIELQRVWAVRAIRAVARGSTSRRPVLAKAGAIPKLATVISDAESDIRQESLFALARIATDVPDNCDAVVDTGVTQVLVDLIRNSGEENERLLAVGVMGQVAAGASEANRVKMSSPSAIDALVALLESKSTPANLQAEIAWTLGSLACADEATRAAIEQTGVMATLKALSKGAKSTSPVGKWTAYALKRIKPHRWGMSRDLGTESNSRTSLTADNATVLGFALYATMGDGIAM